MIKLENCSVYAKERELLSGISLRIFKGSFFCLVGESGGGKTLLSRMMLGLLPEGLEATGTVSVEPKTMEIILQNPIGSMQPNFSLASQFHHIMKSKGIKNKKMRKKKMEELIRFVGFTDSSAILEKCPFQLSGGMCQKIAIAMALAAKPEVIIADEPTSALDQESQNIILELLWRLYQEQQLTIILITHDLTIVKKYGSHVGIIKDGKLIETGTVKQVLKNPEKSYTKELIETVERTYSCAENS